MKEANEDTHPFDLENQESPIGDPKPGNRHTLARESGSIPSRV